jgi:pilus assembly protein CpaB
MKLKLPPGLKYFILAGLAGLIAVFLVQRYIASRTAGVSEPLGQVVVAEMEIPPGTALTPRLLRVATWPRDIIPAKAVANPKQLEGRVVHIPVGQGEPILLTKLAPEGTAAGLGGLLAQNMLAVTVKTDAVSGVAGFVNPGDRVDVLVEMPSPGGGSEHFSRIILQNIKVLSRGQVWDQAADKKPLEVPTVTLEVSPEQAEMLNLATFQGRIRLALRNQSNQAYFPTLGVVSSQLAYKRPPQVTSVAPAATQRSEPRIQVIKGMGITYSEFEHPGQSMRKKPQSKGPNQRLSAVERDRAETVP